MLFWTLCQIQRYEVDVEVRACLLQGPLIRWAGGDEVVVLLQLGQQVVSRVVGEVEIASAEDARARGRWEGQGRRDGRRLRKHMLGPTYTHTTIRNGTPEV